MDLKEQIIGVLQQCYDPELPVDLWNLGLIYEIGLQEDGIENTNVNITMSLTTPGCGMGQHMANDIKEKVIESVLYFPYFYTIFIRERSL